MPTVIPLAHAEQVTDLQIGSSAGLTGAAADGF